MKLVQSYKKIMIGKSVIALLDLAILIFSCIFLNKYDRIYNLAVVLLVSAISISALCIDAKKHNVIFKALYAAMIFVAVIFAFYIVLDATGLLRKMKDFETVKNFILKYKGWGFVIFLLLTLMQVIFLPIPSGVTILIGVAIYGPFVSFILSSIGTIVGSIICFMIGKFFGRRVVNWMIGAENTEKYSALLNQKGKFLFIIMMLFPGFPDDILSIVAGLTTMKWSYFTVVISLTRPVMILIISFLGSGEIIPFRGWGIPVWIALFVLVLVLMLLINKIKNKIMGQSNLEKKCSGKNRSRNYLKKPIKNSDGEGKPL